MTCLGSMDRQGQEAAQCQKQELSSQGARPPDNPRVRGVTEPAPRITKHLYVSWVFGPW